MHDDKRAPGAPADLTQQPAAASATLQQRAQEALRAGALEDALALALPAWAAQGPHELRAALGLVAATALYRLGRWNELLEHAQALLPLLATERRLDDRQELLRWMTLAASEISRFEVAVRCAREAFELAVSRRQPVAEAMSLVGLAMAMERIGDPWQALRLLERARQIAEQAGQPYAQLVVHNTLCATGIGVYYLLADSGSPQALQDVLQQAREHAEAAHALLGRQAVPDLFHLVVEANRGEVAVHLGDLALARTLLDSALRRAAHHQGTPHGWRPRYSQGELMLAEGRAGEAAEHLRALLAEMEHTGSEHHHTRMRVQHTLYRCHRVLGEAERALQYLEAYQRLERERTVAQLKAQSEVFVTRMESEQARREAEAARERAAVLAEEARHDGLTGLGNRRLLQQRLRPLLDQSALASRPLTMAVLDLDHFKQVNDRFGHPVGDRVLVVLAQLLREHTRDADIVARLGGEEFMIVLDGAPAERALEVCERLRVRVAGHDWSAIAPGLAVTISVGLASGPPYEPQALYEHADRALYDAKEAGRNKVMMAPTDGPLARRASDPPRATRPLMP